MFAGGWTLEAAEAVAGDVLDALEALVDRSLVVRAGERFQMLETIREFARERLDDAMRDRHAAWALELAEAAEAGLEGAEQAGWMRRLDAERENLVAAAEWGDAETRQRIAGALWRYWLARGAVAEGRRLVEAALAAGTASATAAARAHNAAGVLAGAAGDHEAARAAFGAALEHVRRPHARGARDHQPRRARRLRLRLRRGAGPLRGRGGDLPRAGRRPRAEHRHPEPRDRARAERRARRRGAELLEESVELARAAGDPAHVASTLHVLGSLLARRGDVDRAVPLVLESLELARGENVLTIECLETLAGVVDPVTGATLLGAAEAAARGDRGGPPAGRAAGRRRAGRRPRRRRSSPTRSRSRSSAAAAPSSAAAVELAMAAARSRSG